MTTQYTQGATTINKDTVFPSLFNEVEKPDISKFSQQNMKTWSGLGTTVAIMFGSAILLFGESGTSDIPESLTQDTSASLGLNFGKKGAEMTLQLSGLVNASTLAESKNHKAVDKYETFRITDKQHEAQAIQKMREHFGIADIELMPLEELRKSMASHGIRAEDNEFSRAIIEEREK